MRIERYYASVKEEVSTLVEPAVELLSRQDYLGFFKACGPSYVRGIRRAQEVTAIFSFDSSDEQSTKKFSSTLRVSSGWWGNRKTTTTTTRREEKYRSVSKNLRIYIVGFGLGLTETAEVPPQPGATTALNELGSETLVADSLQDYMNVMKFAFLTMTRNKNSFHIGMIYGMEVVPWVENTSFQVESGLQDEVLEVPLARSMLERSYKKDDPYNKNYDPATRSTFRCRDLSSSIDKFGYCCEADALYNQATKEYDSNDPASRICRPLRVLDKAIVTENMATNGEFVARLDRSVAYKITQLSTMQNCISAVRSFPEYLDYNILKPQDMVKYDASMKIDFSVLEMKMALDPFADYGLVAQMGKEFDEWMDMFYQPCIAAIFGSNVGTTSDTDPSYFMAFPWHTHEECIHLACFGNSMRWDRENGSCTPSIIRGTKAKENASDTKCAKHIDALGNLTCKHSSEDLRKFHKNVQTVWKQAFPRGNMDYFMEHYCMPQITDEVIDDARKFKLMVIQGRNMDKFPTMNVALNKPCQQSSTYSTGSADKGVDGNQNVKWRHNGQTHTQSQSNPWWEVDLQGDFSIDRIVVHNRMDSCNAEGPCKDRLKGFRIYVINSSGAKLNFGGAIGSPGRETTIDPGTDVSGRKVRIELPGSKKILTLAEVEVFARVPVLTCATVTFTTTTSRWATTGGPIEITGYGYIPNTCYNKYGATCTIELCGLDELELVQHTRDGWHFSVTGDVGGLLSSEFGSSGNPYWLDGQGTSSNVKSDKIRFQLRPRVQS